MHLIWLPQMLKKVEQFIDGLNPEIFRDVSMSEIERMTYPQVVNQAMKAEVTQRKIQEVTKEKKAKKKETREREARECGPTEKLTRPPFRPPP